MGLLPGWVTVLILALEIGLRVILIGIIPGNRRPSTAMAWLLAIFFVPVIAFPLFLVIGNNRLSRGREKRQQDINEGLLKATRHSDLSDSSLSGDPRMRTTVDLNRRLGAFPIHAGNRLRLISDYEESFEWMVEAIDSAEKYVHVLFYIIADDSVYAGPVLDALERAAARGVDVRLLYDHVGTMTVKGYRGVLRRLRKSGIEFHPVLPLRPLKGRLARPDLRNHRKILVVDGERALTGSTNLIEPHYRSASAEKMGRHWVELNVVASGPVVTSLDIVFASDWYAETDEDLSDVVVVDMAQDEAARGGALVQALPSGPGFPAENNLRLFNDLLYKAVDRVVICSPYLVPDDSLLYAITGAAHRGVEVTLLVARKADKFMIHHAQQSFYDVLLEAGVRILRYPDPDVLHAKFILVDDDVMVIGSSNMDMRSFSLNAEVTLMAIDPELVVSAEQILDGYRSVSSELELEDWKQRPLHVKYLDNVFRLAAGLL
ncbi:cardiolipin synthase A [Dietzia lutea]|uniref:Cardiolipin synthase n=2 Tax=Dietzia lutea TaxID=546160 RepID=A0A2S1RBH7_9ACTN|nr:cardiolipin synthase A [Dietzia lutea]